MTNNWSNGWNMRGRSLEEGEEEDIVAEGNETGRCIKDLFFDVLSSMTM